MHRKYPFKKLATKLIVTYMIIVGMSIIALYLTTTRIMEKYVEEQAIEHNMSMVEEVSNYFEEKCKGLKNAITILHSDSVASNIKNDIWLLLEKSGQDADVLETMNMRSSLTSFLRENCLNKDSDLFQVSIVVKETGKVYTASNQNVFINAAIVEEIQKNEKEHSYTGRRVFFAGPIEAGYDKMVFLYYPIVAKYDYREIVGWMVYGYATDFLKNSYKAYDDTKIGEIMLLVEDGTALFSSQKEYIGQEIEYMNLIKQYKNRTYDGDGFIANVVFDDDFEFYTIGLMEKKDLDALGEPIRNVAVLGAVLFIFNAYFFSGFMAKNMTHRVTILLQTMEQVKNGNLSARARLKGADEIKELGDYFDYTFDEVQKYIEKDLQYQLRQKEAQVYALQNQINPHFLYNALESVRMKAIINDDPEVAQMVVYLADIFRNNIKSDMVITLRQEIENCNSFVEFYNIRYNYGIDMICEITDEVYRCKVFRHLVQPVLENAIVHGIDLSKEDNCITIRGWREEDKLHIWVEDNGKGMDEARLNDITQTLAGHTTENISFKKKKGHLGIVNVHERIQLIYGNDCGLTVHSTPGEGTVVNIVVGAEMPEEINRA